jgi:hypothetical protein
MPTAQHILLRDLGHTLFVPVQGIRVLIITLMDWPLEDPSQASIDKT